MSNKSSWSISIFTLLCRQLVWFFFFFCGWGAYFVVHRAYSWICVQKSLLEASGHIIGNQGLNLDLWGFLAVPSLSWSIEPHMDMIFFKSLCRVHLTFNCPIICSLNKSTHTWTENREKVGLSNTNTFFNGTHFSFFGNFFFTKWRLPVLIMNVSWLTLSL